MKSVLIYVVHFLVDNINIGTFLIAILTFGITFTSFYRNRASIDVKQFPEGHSALIKPDFIDFETPDVYWHNDFRLIIDVTITNQSAKPISIVEFVLNKKMKFNSYHKTGELYRITIKPASVTHKGMTTFGSSEILNYPIGDLWLQPILDIPPHTSVRGHLFFHFPDKEMVRIGKNELKVVTSRKIFIKDLDLYDVQESVLPLPDSIYGARSR